MKNKVIQFASMFVVMLVVSLSANAQMSTAHSGEVPFDFTVAGKTFKAGTYRMERADPKTQNGLVTIKDVKNKKIFVFNTLPADRNPTSRESMIFTNIDGEYHLEAISTRTLNASFAVKLADPRLAKWKAAKRSEIALKPTK